MSDTPLKQLSDRGQAVWLDALSRDALRSGALQANLDKDAVVGVTSNPSIFQKAMGEGEAYDEQMREVLEHERDAKEIFFALAHRDIVDACDLLQPAFDASGTVDGRVSWEVDPRYAHDTQATIDEAQRIWDLVDRPNLYVKIPATAAGIPAIEETIARGIPVNVTLIFGLDRYREVMEAYVSGVERCEDPAKVSSVASFFVSRVDTEADKRLDDHPELKGKLAVANARLAYAAYQEVFEDNERWNAQRERGATVQRCLWASTSVKNPDYRDVLYVEELIGPETVNTMPLETVEAFQDHGEVRGDTITEDVAGAHALLDSLATAGVDYDDVIAVLEREGVEKFEDAFRELLEGVEAKRDAFVAA